MLSVNGTQILNNTSLPTLYGSAGASTSNTYHYNHINLILALNF